MRVSVWSALAAFAVGSLATVGISQAPVSGIGSGHRGSQPYTAQFKITSERTLANGTTITRESTELVAVDPEGRRLNVTTTQGTGETPERAMYRLNDPVARTNANWSVPGKSVTVTKMPPLPEPGQARTGCWSSSTVVTNSVAGPDDRTGGISIVAGGIGGGAGSASVGTQVRAANQETTREDLGTQTIQGLVTKGTRTTRTTPAGAIGNDAPIVRTTETWLAHSPTLVVREVTDDPVTGKLTKELVELSQSEPDPATFQPPEGYVVVTQELHAIPCQ